MFSLQQKREECRKAVEIIRNKVHNKPKKKQILMTLTIMSKDNLGGKLPIRQQNTRARCPLVRCSKARHKCFKYSPKISILKSTTRYNQDPLWYFAISRLHKDERCNVIVSLSESLRLSVSLHNCAVSH